MAGRRSKGVRQRLAWLGDLRRRPGCRMSHEPISGARNRYDPIAAIGHRSELLTQRRHLNRKIALLDRSIPPCRAHQRSLREHLARRGNKRLKEAQAPAAHGDRAPVAEQPSTLRIELKRTEGEVCRHGPRLIEFPNFPNFSPRD